MTSDLGGGQIANEPLDSRAQHGDAVGPQVLRSSVGVGAMTTLLARDGFSDRFQKHGSSNVSTK